VRTGDGATRLIRSRRIQFAGRGGGGGGGFKTIRPSGVRARAKQQVRARHPTKLKITLPSR